MSTEPAFLGQGTVTPYTRGELLYRGLWSVVQATVFRWSPRPFHSFRAKLLKWFGADISRTDQVVVFPTAKVTFPKNLRLEPRAMIGPNVTVYNLGKITLKRGANVSQNCHLCAGTHDFNQWSMPLITGPIVLGENSWLGADVFVGPGVEIEELCVVGARSVVVKSMPANQICVGNPCRPIKPRALPHGS